MRILVTGPTGQLGHDIVRMARDAGHDVTPLPRAELDLAEFGAAAEVVVQRLERYDFDVLVNCAAFTRVDDAEADPAAAIALNARAAAALAAACAARGARMVQPSTDYVFDGRADRPYREDHPAAPLNVYGASKLTGEALARAAHPDGTLIVRTASLFGIAGARRAAEGAGGNFVETMIRRARDGRTLRVVDDIVMSPTAAADLARAILHLLDHHAPAGTYHLVNAGATSWYDFARAILDLAPAPAPDGPGQGATLEPVPAAAYPTPARRPAFSALDTARARSLGCVMRPWQEALEDYMRARPGAPGSG